MIPRENKRGRSLKYSFLALLLTSYTVYAGTTGNLTGYVVGPDSNAPVAGVKLIISSPVLQGTRTVVTDSQGFFRITQLPPGDGYRIRFESGGYRTTERTGISVHIDETLKMPTIKLAKVQVQESIEVVEEAPLVEQGTTKIGRTFSNEFLAAIPTARTTSGVLTLAPGSQQDSYGVSFRGATSPENSYVVDGLNTTGVMYGSDSSSLPQEFIQEIQVMTGGYEPEYGRATGGQAVVITKSGGNEFHGDVFAYLTPFEARKASTVSGTDYKGTAKEEAMFVRNDHLQLKAQLGFDIGGYIVKDRLWFFAGYAPTLTRREYKHGYVQASSLPADEQTESPLDPDVPEQGFVDYRTSLSHYYLTNLTFNINQDHSIRLMASGNPSKSTGVATTALNGDPSTYLGNLKSGAMDYILTYNGKFLKGLMNFDFIVGYHSEKDYDTPFAGAYKNKRNDSAGTEVDWGDIDGYQPHFDHRIYTYPDTNTDGLCKDINGDPSPCYTYGYRTGGYVNTINKTDASRLTVKPILSFFLNNVVGNHVFKLGGDLELNRVKNQKGYAGGMYVREASSYYYERYYTDLGEPILWNGEDSDDSYFLTNSTTINTSAFVQDKWELLSNLTFNLGVRWERQELKDGDGFTRLLVNDNIAPRLSVIYDFTKEGKSKLFANVGRYYESIPQDMNDRAMAPEGFKFFRFNKSKYSNYAPGTNDLAQYDYGYTAANGDGVMLEFGGELANIQKGIKGMYSDQATVGFEYEAFKNIKLGITGMYGRLGNVVEDISPDNGGTYVIANPGGEDIQLQLAEIGKESVVDESLTFKKCINGIDTLSSAPSTYCFPVPTRQYQAVELSVEKRFSNNWQAQVSYTLSRTFGNYPGLFTQTNLQLDPNITSQYDVMSALGNRDGYLENDRRHVIKLAGAYQFNFGTSLGLTANIQSGVPVLYMAYNADYGSVETFMLPRGTYPDDAPAEDSEDYVAPRTPWIYDINLNARHSFKFANKKSLSLGVQVNNVFNFQNAMQATVTYTNDYANPNTGGTSLSDVDCYDIATFTNKHSCERYTNFGTPSAYQDPMSIQLEAKFSF